MYLKHDPFQKLVDNFVKYKNISSVMEVVLKYDGIPLNLQSAPRDEAMLDNDIIDVVVQSKQTEEPKHVDIKPVSKKELIDVESLEDDVPLPLKQVIITRTAFQRLMILIFLLLFFCCQ